MGEYLTLLNNIKDYIYNGQLNAARDTLKDLLNRLNLDYMGMKQPQEKARYKSAIQRFLPVLDELRAGKIGASCLRVLALDKSRLPEGTGSIPAPVIPPPSTSNIYGNPSGLGSAGYGGNNYPFGGSPARPYRPEEETPAPVKPNRPVAAEPAPAQPTRPAASANAPARPKKPARGRSGNAFMPLTLNDYIGQENVKRSLRISIAAARKTGNVLAHTMICSHYGLGKTTLANIIANEMGMPFFNVNATNLKDVRSLSLYFSKIEESCIIFIDEIHTLKKDVQTVLLSIMTDFTVNFIDDDGEEQHYDLPPFTLIGATTQAGELLKPFLNRFTVLELQNYTDEEKLILVRSKFAKMGYEADDDALYEIARRCRGVPRTIETYVKGVIDVAISRDETVVSKQTTDLYFEIHGIDGLGLNKNDIKLLTILDEAEKPLALITLESKSAIQREDIEYRYEPYLIEIGFIDKTASGRIITNKGRAYLHPDQVPPADYNDGEELAPADDSAFELPSAAPSAEDVPFDVSGNDAYNPANAAPPADATLPQAEPAVSDTAAAQPTVAEEQPEEEEEEKEEDKSAVPAAEEKILKDGGFADSEYKFDWDSLPDIRFEDIAGLDSVKEVVRVKVLLPLQHPEVFEGYERKSGGGMLLYGPPGTGKTMIAAAIANEIGAKFCSVKPSDLLNQGFGNTEKTVRALFAQAHSFPCAVIYFDEMDSISPKSTKSQYAKQLRSELLAQLQGIDSYSKDKKNILFLIAATNKPWDVDSAFIRPGRFGTKVYVGLPDAAARKYMVERRLQKLTDKGIVSLSEDIDVDYIVEKTNGFNGSDMTNFLDRVEEISALRGIDTGEKNLTKRDFDKALDQISSSVQREDIEKLLDWKRDNDL